MTEPTRKEQYAKRLQDEQCIKLSRSFIVGIIQSLLHQVDQWERLAGIEPRTAEIRKRYKQQSWRNVHNIVHYLLITYKTALHKSVGF